MNLSGKVLVITGGDGILGQAVAATLSGYGARPAILAHGDAPPQARPAGTLHYGGIDLTREDAAREGMARPGAKPRQRLGDPERVQQLGGFTLIFFVDGAGRDGGQTLQEGLERIDAAVL